jgi:hypothetical protein
LVSETKDPVKSAAGKAGMLSRWGVPRRVRLDDFSSDERAAILAAIEAKRAAKSRRALLAETAQQNPSADATAEAA